MTQLFSTEERREAKKEKLKLLIIWFSSLAVFLGITVTLITMDVIIVETTGDRSPQGWMTATACAAGVLFACFSWFFFSIKYKLTRKYCKMLKDMDRGLKDTASGKFRAFDDEISMKDGVYFYSAEFDCKPLKREDITFRKVLIERTKQKPPFEEGDSVIIITHANILVSYEITRKAGKAAEQARGECSDKKDAENGQTANEIPAPEKEGAARKKTYREIALKEETEKKEI